MQQLARLAATFRYFSRVTIFLDLRNHFLHGHLHNISLTMSLLLRVAEAPVDYLTLRDELMILYTCVRKT